MMSKTEGYFKGRKQDLKQESEASTHRATIPKTVTSIMIGAGQSFLIYSKQRQGNY